VLVVGKLYELLRDRSVSRHLLDLELRTAGIDQLSRALQGQRDSMLASLHAAMINVFRSRPSDGMLHDEIANFVSQQQDQFTSFRRRLEFLADTAGALGLLGTVWGMFTVFFQGTSDKDVILRGMGIALITTLLGLVVSIILNLCATELSTFFDKRLAQVARKSDGLRFRLLELAGVPAGDSPVVREAVRAPVAPIPLHPLPSADHDDHRTAWCYLDSEVPEYTARAGELVSAVRLHARRNGGTPVEGLGITVTVPSEAGALESGDRHVRLETDDDGHIQFAWQAPSRAGSFALEASVLGQPGSMRRVPVRVDPGPPHRLVTEGNHQAAVAGMRLARRLGVTVLDRFDNPVPEQPVTFTVVGGDGRFGADGTTTVIRTGADGAARTPFVVSSAAGPNAIVARLDGQISDVDFVVFGTEM